MATLRRRGKRWQAQVRRKGRPAISRNFRAKSEALVWALEQEFSTKGDLRFRGRSGASRWPTSSVAIATRSCHVSEGPTARPLILNAFLRHPLASVALRYHYGHGERILH